jgi:hypothetical protein
VRSEISLDNLGSAVLEKEGVEHTNEVFFLVLLEAALDIN